MDMGIPILGQTLCSLCSPASQYGDRTCRFSRRRAAAPPKAAAAQGPFGHGRNGAKRVKNSGAGARAMNFNCLREQATPWERLREQKQLGQEYQRVPVTSIVRSAVTPIVPTPLLPFPSLRDRQHARGRAQEVVDALAAHPADVPVSHFLETVRSSCAVCLQSVAVALSCFDPMCCV